MATRSAALFLDANPAPGLGRATRILRAGGVARGFGLRIIAKRGGTYEDQTYGKHRNFAGMDVHIRPPGQLDMAAVRPILHFEISSGAGGENDFGMNRPVTVINPAFCETEGRSKGRLDR
jgi:hypothetical protein